MEGINIQQVGHFGNSGRIGTPVPVTTTSYLCSSRLVEQHKGSGKAQSSFGRNIFHADQRSYRGYTGTPGEFSRVLLPSFSCEKEDRGVAPGHRPVHFEPVSSYTSFQNGNQQVYSGFGIPGHVDNVPGSVRCLFPHPDSSLPPPFSAVRMDGQGLCLQGPSIWPGNSSFGFHQNHAGAFRPSALQGHQSPRLSGRFSGQSGDLPGSFSQHYVCTRYSPQSGVFDFMGKVRSDSVPGFHFPRGTFPYPEGNCPTPRGEVQYPVSENICFSDQRSTSCSTFSTTVGVSEFNSGNRPIGTTPHQTPSVVSQGILGSSVPTLGCYDSHSSSFTPSFALVDSERSRVIGCSSHPTSTYLNPVHGCIMSGLGSLPRGQVCSRDLVSFTSVGPHQSTRNEGSSVSLTTFQSGPQVQVSVNCNRQHHSSGLPTETRRHSVCIPVSSLQRDSASVRFPVYQAVCSSHSGQTEHSSGHVVEVSDSSEHRMGTSPVCISQNHTHVVQTDDRPLCDLFEQQAANIHVPHSGPEGLRSGRNVSLVGRDASLRIPSPLSSFQNSAQDSFRSRGLQDHSYCSSLEQSVVVSRSSGLILQPPSISSSKSRPSLSKQKKVVSSKSGETSSTRLDAVRKNLSQRGFSGKAAKRISCAVRESTGAVYDSKWSIFCTWCVSRKIDPFTVTAQQLADFFIYLFEEKGYSPSTIKGYRSAISRTIAIMGGPDFGQDEFLSLLIRNFHLERPRIKLLVPQWNLSLVLHCLKKEPFEPASQVALKYLSYKCCFLLALASGRRRSEIHALSVAESCLRFAQDDSSVTLITDPAFLAKNQLPDKGAEPIFVPALSTISSSEQDLLLCPVRILKIYLLRTKSLRSRNSSRLFIPVKSGVDTISAKSISTWICKCVYLAYNSSEEDIKACRVKASSWSLFNNGSISEILNAGFWRSNDTFTSFYLRSMSNSAGNLYSLGPMVASQRVVCPVTSGSSAIL